MGGTRGGGGAARKVLSHARRGLTQCAQRIEPWVRNVNRLVPGKTLDKCAAFLIFPGSACEKRHRRFALPAQSKKVLWSAVGSGSPHRFFWEQYLEINFSVSWRV